MNRLYYLWILFMAAIFVQRVLSVPSAATDVPDDEDEDDFDDSEESAEADDDGRIYKNPRNSPSSDCPRDEEQATLLGQKCLRKCSSHEDCKSKKKKCLCDGTCGMSCIKPDRECPELPQPELGTVTLSGREFGGKAVYTCPLGYNVVGLAERLCRNGQWTGSQPICSKNIFCLTPPVIEHARHSALPEQATFELDSAVQYHCYTGYVTAGFPRAKCLAIDGHASWYGPDINCEPRSCGQPTDPTHGWHAGECYTFGCRITYHCGEGYELVGKSERFCQATGDWSPKEMPTCVLVTSVVCPIPESPKNGKAIYTSLSYNSIVSYECRYGYTLVNDSSRRCGADRKWSGSLPTCKEINCGSPGVLFNGWLENIDAGTGLGASIIFRCQPGMLLAGNTSTVCQVDGRWRYPVPECLAPCVIPTVQQGTVIAMEKELDPNATTPVTPTLPPTSNQVIHGTTLEVVCEDRYEFPIISSAPPTCMNGTWSIIPRCTPARCKTLPKPPKFGMVLAPKTEHGMKARFKCKDGFKLTGPDGKEVIDENEYVRTCAFGNWTGLTPMCQELFCAFPGYVEHGKVLLIGNMGLYDYRPYVRKIMNNKQIMYDCDKGYILNEKGPVGATCVGGVWRPTELPECSPGLHPRLRWNRRKRAAKIEQKHKILRNFGRFKREISEVLRRNAVIEDPFPLRQKRSLLHHRGGQRKIHRRIIPNHNINHKWHLVAPAIMRFKRNIARKRYPEIDYQFVRPLRNEFQQQQQRIRFEEAQRRAYNKYYEKIRQKHRNYINNLLRASHSQRVIDDDEPLVFDNKGDPYADDDDYKTPAQDPFDEINAYASMPIPLPNINEDRNIYAKKEINDGIVNNTFVGRSHSDAVHDENGQIGNRNYLPQISRQHEKNVSDIVNLLQSQIVRRRKRILLGSKGVHNNGKLFHRVKRAPRAPKKSEDPIEEDGNGSDTEGSRKSKTKEPCEPIAMKPYIRIDIVREGRDPSNEFGTGTIIRATCAKEYRLNLQNPNGTAKCVRGRWKPLKPECTLVPCSIASTAHGAYVALVVDQKDDNGKTTMQPLNAFDEVQSGEIVQVNCDEGYTVQGPNRLKCQEGSWDVNGLPECVPAPCSLPNISNAVYQEGYRGGLTIAHAASVSVQCEGSEETVQMKCSLGNLTPQTVQCQPAQISAIAKKTRESEYLGEVDFFSSNQDVTSILTGFNKINEKFGKSKILNMKTENSGSYYQHTFGEGKPCGMPTRVEETILYKNGEPVTDADEGFESGTEITFNCIKGAAGERTTWKIVCEDGTWNGRSFDCTNGTCIFYNDEPNVVSFYNDLRIDEGVVEFPPGATIVSRCVDIGKYQMLGNNVLTCIHSDWNGIKPTCLGLNQENDYAMEKSPTILFRHHNGPIAQSNDGKLVVYPGTTVHMECLWMRRFGNPKWSVNHTYRNYPEGWVTDEGRDNTLEYRLSIFHAVEEDTGIFTCSTPARHDHTVEVLVRAIHCPEIPSKRGLKVNVNDTKMGSKIQLSCINGNSLIGSSELTCMPSGNWSSALPVCESIECGDIPILASSNRSVPRVTILSREVGGRATFSCQTGYGLRGPSQTTCLSSGEWAQPFPSCSEVQCDNPGAPVNGYAQGSAPYRAGDVIQFNCNPEYMIQGQPIIACQDNGRWSGVLPKCVQACSYPGTAISGRMSSVKFYYSIGESITFTCDTGLELKGARTIKCLRNAKWSNAIPSCVGGPEQANV